MREAIIIGTLACLASLGLGYCIGWGRGYAEGMWDAAVACPEVEVA